MEMINKTLEVENNGRDRRIRITEEQKAVNTILRTDCACPGCHMECSSHNPSTGESKKQQQSRTELRMIMIGIRRWQIQRAIDQLKRQGYWDSKLRIFQLIQRRNSRGEDDDVDMNEVVSEGYRVDEMACMLGLGTQNR